jgi:putative PIN family toxin of toxin-antitoxin system
MQKIVIDTNILVSALMNDTGNPAKVASLFADKKVEAFYSATIMVEYEYVLNREEFNFAEQKVLKMLNGFKTFGKIFIPVKSGISFIDEDDRVFYDTVKQSGSFLVTGNKRHYPQEDFIISPTEFLAKYTELELPAETAEPPLEKPET